MTSINVVGQLSAESDRDNKKRDWEFASLFDLPLSASALDAPSPWNMRAPVLAWLIGAFRPATIVDLDLCGDDQFDAVCDAVRVYDVPTNCYRVTPAEDPRGGHDRRILRHPILQASEDDPNAEAALTADQRASEVVEAISLLHIGLPTSQQAEDWALDPWLDRLQPGSIVVVTGRMTTAEEPDVCSALRDRFPLVYLGESLALAQVPIGTSAPLVDELYTTPLLRFQVSLLAERGQYRYVIGKTPHSPAELRIAIDRILHDYRGEIQRTQNDMDSLHRAFEQAVGAKRQLAEDLARERERHANELVDQHQRDLDEHRDQMDAVAAKLSISVARYERRIAELSDELAKLRRELDKVHPPGS